MKKLIVLLASVLFAFMAVGQSVSNATANYTLNVGTDLTYLRYTGQAADTVGSSDSTWTYTIAVDKVLDQLKVECRVELDSVSGTPNTAAYLKGRTFVQDSWTTLTTVNWVDGSDTTFYLSNATAKPYRFYQIAFDAVADTTQRFKLDEFEFKLYK